MPRPLPRHRPSLRRLPLRQRRGRRFRSSRTARRLSRMDRAPIRLPLLLSPPLHSVVPAGRWIGRMPSARFHRPQCQRISPRSRPPQRPPLYGPRSRPTRPANGRAALRPLGRQRRRMAHAVHPPLPMRMHRRTVRMRRGTPVQRMHRPRRAAPTANKRRVLRRGLPRTHPSLRHPAPMTWRGRRSTPTPLPFGWSRSRWRPTSEGSSISST